jgi:hypothetical protein
VRLSAEMNTARELPDSALAELYEMSGHWAHYREGMFPSLNLGSEHLLRPGLCPHPRYSSMRPGAPRGPGPVCH